MIIIFEVYIISRLVNVVLRNFDHPIVIFFYKILSGYPKGSGAVGFLHYNKNRMNDTFHRSYMLRLTFCAVQKTIGKIIEGR